RLSSACVSRVWCLPDVFSLGVRPLLIDRFYEALGTFDLFLSIGKSGTIYPAAGFVFEAKSTGAHAVELNLEPSEGADLFDERLHGPATAIVPMYVERLLAG